MKIRTLLLGAAASLALGSSAHATNIDGWYISLEGGGNWIDDADFTTPSKLTAEFDTGWTALGAIGYGINKWRIEFEGGYRDNNIDRFLNAAKVPVVCGGCVDPGVSEITLMGNVLYDFPVTERVSFTLGLGAGADRAELDAGPGFEDDEWVFAAQAIAGLNYQIGQTELYVNYHYLWVDEPSFSNGTGTTWDFDNIQKHAATLGLRFHFGAPAAEPIAAPPPPPPPPPAAPTTPREFIVFFGFNKSNLTDEALGVVKQAAAAAKEYGSATITLVGHADRSGSDAYNQKLSLKRGNTVKGALITEGISASSITVSGKGEADPMVPTADGVREPQNRRVHITL